MTAPRATFERVVADPRWAGVLVATWLVAALTSTILLETETGRLALLDQWERTALAFGDTVDDAQYALLAQASRHGTLYAISSSFVSGPLLVLALSAALFALFRTGTARGPRFRQVFAVVAYAGVILAVRQLVAAPAAYARETLASPTTLSLLVPMLDETSLFARFFGALDLFVLWWIVALATGMSVLYGRPVRRLAVIFTGTYVALAGGLAAVMAVTGGAA